MSADSRLQQVLERLRALADPANLAGMAHFGINTNGSLGISIPALQRLAREIGTDHGLALELWASGIQDARILASFIDDPRQVREAQAEAWVRDFNSWDVCDQVCDLFERTEFAWRKSLEWCGREEEFVKRAGFATLAGLAVHDKAAADAEFERFFPVLEAQAWDERNFVRKALNWALRNIGKRNLRLNTGAVACARRIAAQGSRSARWIAADALRELTAEKTLVRLQRKGAGKSE